MYFAEGGIDKIVDGKKYTVEEWKEYEQDRRSLGVTFLCLMATQYKSTDNQNI